MYLKTFSKWLLSCTLVFSISLPSFADNFITYGTPEIDGVLKPGEWFELSHIRMARFYGNDQFADIWMQWDDNYLYIAGVMQDKTFHENDGSGPLGHTWDDDSIEIYLHSSHEPPAKLDQNSRILAFTPEGKYQRLDRGIWAGSNDPNEATIGLESIGNTAAKIEKFLGIPLAQGDREWASCPVEGGLKPAPEPDVKTLFAEHHDNQSWQFEVALPWRLVGTEIKDNKIVGGNCKIGKGIVPAKLTPRDGMPLRMNFYRVNDDTGGQVQVSFDPNIPEMVDAVGNKSPNGIMRGEWFSYQGDRYHPNEWAAFVLSDRRVPSNEGPKFNPSKEIQGWSASTDGRRARLAFNAPTRNSGGSAYRYLIKYQEEGGIVQDFINAYQPAAPNAWQEIDVIGLNPGKKYIFTVQAVDELGRISADSLTKTVEMPSNNLKPFVGVSPTGRSLVYSDGRPFVISGETVLMPWLPVRGWFDEPLCDGEPDKNLLDNYRNADKPEPRVCGNGITKKGTDTLINGRERNYSNEDLYYNCKLSTGKLAAEHNGRAIIVAKTKRDNAGNLDEYPDSALDNCQYVVTNVYNLSGTVVKAESIEGPQVAIDYMSNLKKAGINVVTVFVESLDLDASPIVFEYKKEAILRFMDRLVAEAEKNDVYVLFRLYDTFYYKDDKYDTNPKKRKWTDTWWNKVAQKSSPDSFFDNDLDDSHKERFKALLERFRDKPNVLGWDLVNEIDNKVRFNEASLEKRRGWLERMAAFAKSVDRNHLVFYSFLTWDPKDGPSYRAAMGSSADGKSVDKTNYIGMDAATAYRLPNIDLAVTHGYYAHVANPWDFYYKGGTPCKNPPAKRAPPEYAPALELARGISYGFHQIRDGRPMLDGESSPNAHLFHKYYGHCDFTEAVHDTMFMDMAWLHFVSGGAGLNLAWPADLEEEIPGIPRKTINKLSDAKRNILAIFMKNVRDIVWHGDQLRVERAEQENDKVIASRYDAKNAVIYAYNPNKADVREIPLAPCPTGEAQVTAINTRDGSLVFNKRVEVGEGKSITLDKGVNGPVAVIVGNSGNCSGKFDNPPRVNPADVPAPSGGYLPTPDTWIKAVIHTEDRGAINAVWKQGGDKTLKRGDRVIWGYFHASPQDVTWGDENNPDIFVKIWFDVSGRVDVNFFHVSVPDIEVSSCIKTVENCHPGLAKTTKEKRYARHTYRPKEGTKDNPELLNTPTLSSGKVQGNPKHYGLPFYQVELGSIFQLDGGKTIEGVWHEGGSGTTPRGDQVAWGYFYANPQDVEWGSEQNPEIYVKFWYDKAGNRIDVNFFHVSAPNINVYSGRSGSYSGTTLVTQQERYAQQQ